MSTYVIGDIHGQDDLLEELLMKIGPAGTDTIYTIGDIIDRGPHPMGALFKLMEMPNVIPLLGNHELMAEPVLTFISEQAASVSAQQMDRDLKVSLAVWMRNGAQTTISEFASLPPRRRALALDYIRNMQLFAQVPAGGSQYLLVHAGLGGFSPERPLEDYTVHELVWERPDYDRRCFPDVSIVCGHTPTQLIEGNLSPGFIYRSSGNIVIDCGACFAGGRLAAICLDTGEEFYSSENQG